MCSAPSGTMPEDFISSIDREERCLQINRLLQHIPSVFSIQSKDFSFQIQMLHFTFNAHVMETGKHSHRFYELAFPLRDMRYQITGKNRITEADSGLLLIPPGEVHDRIAEKKNALCFGMVFDLQSDHPEKMEAFLRSLRLKGYKMEISLEMRRVLKDICSRFGQEKDEFSGSLHYLLFNQFLMELMRENFSSFFSHQPESLVPDPAEKILVYLEHNLLSPDILDGLARRTELSKRHLNRLFVSRYGLSIKQWVLRERIRLAAHLLLTTGDPVKQIAGHCGFNNMSYFSRLFFRFYNNTPSYYRSHG